MDTTIEPYLSIDRLVELTGKARRTIDNRIAALKKNDRPKYDAIVTKQGHKIVYEAKTILQYLNSPSIGITPKKEQKLTGKKKRGPNVGSAGTSSSRLANIEKNIWQEQIVVQVDEYSQSILKKTTDATQKKRLEMVLLILNDWVTGMYTVPQACDRQGGTYDTFIGWINFNPDLKELYKRAEKKRGKALRALRIEAAETNLHRLVSGYQVELDTVTYIERTLANGQKVQIPQERKRTQKHIIPNVTAIIFSLTNDKPNKYKRNFFLDKEPGNVDDPLDKMSTEELQAIVQQGEQQGFIKPPDTNGKAD